MTHERRKMAGDQTNTNKADMLPRVQFTSEKHVDEAKTAFLNTVDIPGKNSELVEFIF